MKQIYFYKPPSKGWRRFDKWVSSQKKPIKPPQPVFPSLEDTLKSLTNWHGITVRSADSCYANRAENNVCESGCELVSSRFKDSLMRKLSYGVTFIVSFLYLQGVLHWKIQLLPGWSQSRKQVTSDQVWGTLETNLPRGPDTNMLSARVDVSSICCFSCRWWWKKWSWEMFSYLIPEGCKISILLLWDSKMHLL